MFGLERKHDLNFDFKVSWLCDTFMGTAKIELGRHVFELEFYLFTLKLSECNMGGSKQ